MIKGLQLRTRAQFGVGASTESRSFSLFLVQAFWVLMVFEVDWFLMAKTGGPFNRIPTLLAPVLGLAILSRGNRRAVYWPLIVFVTLHLAASLFAENAGLSRDALKYMLYILLLFASSVSFLDSPSKLIVILKLYLLSFAWFGIQGMPGSLGGLHRGAGLVGVMWHPLLSNEDSYGPLMVMSMAFSYFFALAASSPRWRWIARGMVLVSVLGVILSFARGASISAAVVLLYILLRTPHRTKALTGLMLAAIVLLPAVTRLVPMDAYVETIASSSEGDETRTTLWKLAWHIFKESPVYGVGAGNYGVAADRMPGEMTAAVWGGLYARTPHNPHFQILAEEGLIGIAVWIAMIAGFFRWNRRLRTQDANALWRKHGGTELDLKMIARGLEGAMVAYLATSIFYNQLYIHWFWSLLTISYVAFGLTRPTGVATTSSRAATQPRVLGPSQGGNSKS